MFETAKSKKTQYTIYIFFLLLVYFQELSANKLFFVTPTLQEDIEYKKISLISADIEVIKITSTSTKDTHAQWTLKAENNIRSSLGKVFSNQQNEFHEYKIPFGESRTEIIELISLQGLINKAILSNFKTPLPSKNNFDWSIGPDANLLKISSGADYGLFFSFRAGFSATTSTAQYQVGMFSLVDLTSGQTVWFILQPNLKGDIRDQKQALSIINNMLEMLAKSNS